MLTNAIRCAAIGLAVAVVGCASAPKTTQGQNALESQAYAALQSMKVADPTLDTVLEGAVGYAVFPEIAKGGAIVGGAYGEGVVYVNDQVIGYAELNQGSIGAQLGGQTFSELIVFRDRAALDRLMSGNFAVGVEASAVAVKAGAARSATFENGQAVFVKPRGGLMAELSVSGQQIDFVRL